MPLISCSKIQLACLGFRVDKQESCTETNQNRRQGKVTQSDSPITQERDGEIPEEETLSGIDKDFPGVVAALSDATDERCEGKLSTSNPRFEWEDGYDSSGCEIETGSRLLAQD